MSGWPIVRLGDFIEVKGGKRLPKGHVLQTNDNGAPYIRIVDLDAGNVVEANLAFVPEETQPHIERYRVSTGDVFISIVGTVGLVALIPRSLDRAFLTENAARLVASDRRLSSSYLRYVLASDFGQNSIREQTVGSTQPKLALGRIKDIAIPLPPFDVQTSIAEVLGALDDKIAANTKVVERTADLATSTFLWAQSLPGSRLPLAGLVTTQYGFTTSAHSEPGPKFLRVTDINKYPWITWDSTPNCTISDADLAKYRVQEGDILVARMADPGKSAFIDAGDPEAVFASYLVRLKATHPDDALFIYYFLRSDEYRNYSDGAMQGSVQMNMNAKLIIATDIFLPTRESISLFNKRITPLRRVIQSVLKENIQLAATRDALLPQLMSGKLRVKDAERVLEDAGV